MPNLSYLKVWEYLAKVLKLDPKRTWLGPKTLPRSTIKNNLLTETEEWRKELLKFFEKTLCIKGPMKIKFATGGLSSLNKEVKDSYKKRS